MNAPASQPITPMQALSNRLRRIMLVTGLGLLSAVVGSVIIGPVGLKLAPKLSGLPPLVAGVIGVIVGRFWLIGVLPAVGYAVGRALRLKPLGLAFGAAIAGEVFFSLVEIASVGITGLFANKGLLAARIGTLAFGILITLRTTRAGVAAGERAQADAARVSETRRSEYAELLAESQRLAERNEANAQPPPEASADKPQAQ